MRLQSISPPPPSSVRLQLTDLHLTKAPLAIGDLSSCSAPSKSSPPTPSAEKHPHPSSFSFTQTQLVPKVRCGFFPPVSRQVIPSHTHAHTHTYVLVYISLSASFLFFIKSWQRDKVFPATVWPEGMQMFLTCCFPICLSDPPPAPPCYSIIYIISTKRDNKAFDLCLISPYSPMLNLALRLPRVITGLCGLMLIIWDPHAPRSCSQCVILSGPTGGECLRTEDFSGADLNSPFTALAGKLRDTSYEGSLEGCKRCFVFGNHVRPPCGAQLNQFDLIYMHPSSKMFATPRKEPTARANFIVTRQQKEVNCVFSIFYILTQDVRYRHEACETPGVNR